MEGDDSGFENNVEDNQEHSLLGLQSSERSPFSVELPGGSPSSFPAQSATPGYPPSSANLPSNYPKMTGSRPSTCQVQGQDQHRMGNVHGMPPMVRNNSVSRYGNEQRITPLSFHTTTSPRCYDGYFPSSRHAATPSACPIPSKQFPPLLCARFRSPKSESNPP